MVMDFRRETLNGLAERTCSARPFRVSRRKSMAMSGLYRCQ